MPLSSAPTSLLVSDPNNPPGTHNQPTMGIKGLSQLIGDNAPGAIKENEFKNYFGRKVAVDASMWLYQFLVAVRSEGNNLTNADGETTSHIMGMFYRTIRLVHEGIKPIYVFDGKPPDMKGGEVRFTPLHLGLQAECGCVPCDGCHGRHGRQPPRGARYACPTRYHPHRGTTLHRAAPRGCGLLARARP